MAVGTPTVTEETLTVVSDSRFATVSTGAGGVSATEMIVGIAVKSAPLEFELIGVSLTGVADEVATLKYNCKGPGTVTYSIIVEVSKVGTA